MSPESPALRRLTLRAYVSPVRGLRIIGAFLLLRAHFFPRGLYGLPQQETCQQAAEWRSCLHGC